MSAPWLVILGPEVRHFDESTGTRLVHIQESDLVDWSDPA
jgi:hypothetical protein